jgi:hypothetical protein
VLVNSSVGNQSKLAAGEDLRASGACSDAHKLDRHWYTTKKESTLVISGFAYSSSVLQLFWPAIACHLATVSLPVYATFSVLFADLD